MVKKRVFFIIPALTGGGAERVISQLLTHLDKKKFNLSLVLVKKEGPFLNEIPNTVKIYDLKISRTLYSPFKILRLVWREKPEIVFSTLGHLNLIIATLKWLMPGKVKFIGRESNTISYHNKNEKYPKLFDFLFKTVYKNLDLIVCQSKFMKQDLFKNYNVPEEKMIIIRNPVNIKKVNSMAAINDFALDNSKVHFLAVGRLSKQKGYERLLQVFSILDDNNIHLLILGEGEDEKKLKEIVKKKNLKEKVSFLGFQKNPYKYMSKANFLIMTSHYEGLPNVALESNACGTPVLAFDTPGLNEVIENDLNGWLIPDGEIKTMADKIKEIKNIELDKTNIQNRVQENYNVTKIVKEYEQLFEQL